MFCENCGTKIQDGAAFCENCGTPVPAAEPVAPVAPAFRAAPEPEPVAPAPQPEAYAQPQQPQAYAQPQQQYQPPQQQYQQPQQQYGYQQGFAQQNYQQNYYQPNPLEGVISTANTLGILSIVGAFVFNIAGIILGAIGLNKVKALAVPPELEERRAKAQKLNKIGLILSIIFLALGIIGIMVTGCVGSSSYYY